MIERKGGRTFSSPGPIKSKLCVFVLQVQLGALQPAHSSSLLLFFSSLFCFFLFFSWFFFFFLYGFICLPVGECCVLLDESCGHREDAHFGGTSTQSCLLLWSRFVLVDS